MKDFANGVGSRAMVARAFRATGSRALPGLRFSVKFKITVNIAGQSQDQRQNHIKVKGFGQECPTHTGGL
jgi:hypothetical protein